MNGGGPVHLGDVFTLHHRRAGIRLDFHDAGVRGVKLTDDIAVQLADRDRDELRITLAAPFEARHAGGETWPIDPAGDDERLGRIAFALRHAWLARCEADDDGTLRAVFERGLTVVAPPAPDRAAWALSHAAFELGAVPGGGLAVHQVGDAAPHAR